MLKQAAFKSMNFEKSGINGLCHKKKEGASNYKLTHPLENLAIRIRIGKRSTPGLLFLSHCRRASPWQRPVRV